ncbi:MAG TPA: hypothetical protein VJ570_12230 [Holophagaceae bacterium]|nr:hypothetical protein [Holophagaceae bacterium]
MSLKLLAILFALGPALGALAPEPLPPLAAVITTEQRQLTADGLTKQVRFQERFLRMGDRVWLERVLPSGTPPGPEGSGHGHLDLDLAARLVRLQPDGQMALSYIHRGERTVVSAEARDYPEVGFHDSWGVVAHLVEPELLAKLKPLPRRSGVAGAVWYGRKNSQGWLRVLWSSRHRMALAVESASTDGHRMHRTTVRLQPMPRVLPWDQLQGYAQKEYTDLLD